MKTFGMLLVAGGLVAYIVSPEKTKAVGKALRDRMTQRMGQMCHEMMECCEKTMLSPGIDKIQEQNARILELLEELRASGKRAPKKASDREGES